MVLEEVAWGGFGFNDGGGQVVDSVEGWVRGLSGVVLMIGMTGMKNSFD